ncbi:MAG TPA: hypothetical protein VHT28_06945 [Silvibacterium sp.]|nr:hypothetical protein [Silvibacterium sp.]
MDLTIQIGPEATGLAEIARVAGTPAGMLELIGRAGTPERIVPVEGTQAGTLEATGLGETLEPIDREETLLVGILEPTGPEAILERTDREATLEGTVRVEATLRAATGQRQVAGRTVQLPGTDLRTMQRTDRPITIGLRVGPM